MRRPVPAVTGVPITAGNRGRVPSSAFAQVSLTDLPLELIFTDDALAPIRLALDAVLRRVSFVGKQPNDRIASPRRGVVTPVGRELYRLPNAVSVICHSILRRRDGAAWGGRRSTLRGLFSLKVDRRGLALLTRLELIAKLLPFAQVAHSRPLHGGNMHEYVLRAVIRLNEPIAFLAVEPFNSADRHLEIP